MVVSSSHSTHGAPFALRAVWSRQVRAQIVVRRQCSRRSLARSFARAAECDAAMSDRTVGMMDPAYFVGRRELLDWINTTLELNVARIEDTCNGAVACQLMDAIQPGTVAMGKVNWGAKDDYAKICNYKLLQSAFGRASVAKPVEVNRLIRGKYQDNLEFMQWCKAFCERHQVADGYDPIERRSRGKGAGGWGRSE